MFVVSGASGQVGRAAAMSLVGAGHRVRALVIDEKEQAEWDALGQQSAVVDFNNADTLLRPLEGAEGVFLMLPPNYQAQAGYAQARSMLTGFVQALQLARPEKVVALSSIGAHRTSNLGLIEQSYIFEQVFKDNQVPACFLRPAWFMQNVAWQLPHAASSGKLESYLTPLDRKIPMTSAVDVGLKIAQLLVSNINAGILEIEGPSRYSPRDVAAVVANALGRPVSAVEIQRSEWRSRFIHEGTKDPAERIAMLDGFNSGWIDFEGGEIPHEIMSAAIENVVASAVQRIGLL